MNKVILAPYRMPEINHLQMNNNMENNKYGKS